MTTPSGRRRALAHLTRRGVSPYLCLSRRVACYAEARVLIERWRRFYNER